MNVLNNILIRLQEAIVDREAKCVIVDYGIPSESSLMGTRDGLLNLTVELIRFIAECEDHVRYGGSDASQELEKIPEQEAMWGDGIKKAIYRLPVNHPFLVGCYLFENSRALLTALEESVKHDLREGEKLTNDPEFKKLS